MYHKWTCGDTCGIVDRHICWDNRRCDRRLLRRICLRSETSVTFLHRRLCDLCCSTDKASSGVLNQCHDACGKFLPPVVRSVLLFVVLADICAGLYPPGSSRSTIELPLKVSQGPSFPMLILCAAIKLILFIYSLVPQWFGLCDVLLCI